MLTTVTPGAQLLSRERSAVSPPHDAPYPVDVGTATIGQGARPATTGASAASMPATTTIACSERNWDASVRSRWMPATPMS